MNNKSLTSSHFYLIIDVIIVWFKAVNRSNRFVWPMERFCSSLGSRGKRLIGGRWSKLIEIYWKIGNVLGQLPLVLTIITKRLMTMTIWQLNWKATKATKWWCRMIKIACDRLATTGCRRMHSWPIPAPISGQCRSPPLTSYRNWEQKSLDA